MKFVTIRSKVKFESFVQFCFLIALLAMLGLPISALATALSDSRNTPEKDLPRVVVLTVASNSIIYAGSIVAVNSSGKAVPAADSSGYAVIGRANETVDNRTAVYVATKKISVGKGIFRYVNGDVIVAADIGKIVYITDDQTVNKTGGGQNIIAGSVYDVDSDGVWVDTGRIGPIGAATPSSLAVSGAATVGSTLAVTGAGSVGGAFTVTGAQTNAATLKVDGVATLASASITGAASVGGILTVTGAQTNAAAMTIVGLLTANGAIISTNGVITILNLPTSTNGLTSGKIWANSNVLTVYP